tara:strand:- start:246 stop:410 length:165 start_codon:yes stop_codon:yes gene_type:complete
MAATTATAATAATAAISTNSEQLGAEAAVVREGHLVAYLLTEARGELRVGPLQL